MLMGQREMDNIMPGEATAGQNATEGIQCKSYSEIVIEGVRRRARVFAGDSIVRKTDRAKQGGRRGGFLSRGKNRGYHREGEKNQQGRFYFGHMHISGVNKAYETTLDH